MDRDDAVKQQLLQLEADYHAGRITKKGYQEYYHEIMLQRNGPTASVLPGSPGSPASHRRSSSSPSETSSHSPVSRGSSTPRSGDHHRVESPSKYGLLAQLQQQKQHMQQRNGHQHQQEQQQHQEQQHGHVVRHHTMTSELDSDGEGSMDSFDTAVGNNAAVLELPRTDGFDVTVVAEETTEHVWDERSSASRRAVSPRTGAEGKSQRRPVAEVTTTTATTAHGSSQQHHHHHTAAAVDDDDDDDDGLDYDECENEGVEHSQRVDVYAAFSSVRPPTSPRRHTEYEEVMVAPGAGQHPHHHQQQQHQQHQQHQQQDATLYSQPGDEDDAIHEQWQQVAPVDYSDHFDFPLPPPPPPPPLPRHADRFQGREYETVDSLPPEIFGPDPVGARAHEQSEARRSKKNKKASKQRKKKKDEPVYVPSAQQPGREHQSLYEQPAAVSSSSPARRGRSEHSALHDPMRRLSGQHKTLSYKPVHGHVERVQRMLQEEAQNRGRIPRERYETLSRQPESEAHRFLTQLRKAKRTVLPFSERALQGMETPTPGNVGVSPHGNRQPFASGYSFPFDNSTDGAPQSTDSIDLTSATTFAESLTLRYSYVPNASALQVHTRGGKACTSFTWKMLRKQARAVSEVLQQAMAARRGEASLIANTDRAHSGSRQHYAALIFDSSNPTSISNFAVAFHGATMGGLIPVPLAFPMADDPASMHVRVRSLGFVMSSCAVSIVISDTTMRKVLDEACGGALTRGPLPKGWPDVPWMFVDRLPRMKKTRQRGVHVSNRDDIAFAMPDLATYNDIKTVAMTHDNVFAQTAAFKASLSLSNTNQVSVVADVTTGPGMWVALATGVTCGYETIVIPSYTIDKKPKQTWAHLSKSPRADTLVVVDVDGLKALTGTREAIDAFAAHIPDVGRFVIMLQNVVQRDVVKCVKALVHKGLPQQRVLVSMFSATGNFIMTGPLAQFRTDGEHVRLSCVLPAPGMQASMNMGLVLASPLAGAYVGVVRVHADEPCVETEQGEIVISSKTAASQFVGLEMQSANTFAVTVPGASESMKFTRTGLLGCVNFKADGKPEVVVTGLRRDLMMVEGFAILRFGIENTITDCQEKYKLELPMSGRDAAIFVDSVAGSNRLVLILETAFDVLDETDPKDVDKTLQLLAGHIEKHNQIRPFAMLLVEDNVLPRNINGRVDSELCAELYTSGRIDALHVCVDSISCIPDIVEQTSAESLDRHGSVGIIPALETAPSQLSQLSGPEIHLERKLASANTILSLLVKKLRRSPDTPIFTFVDEKAKRLAVTPKMLMTRARQIAQSLHNADVKVHDVVLVIVPPSPDLVASFYACLLLGALPILLPTATTRDDVHTMMPVWESVAQAMHAGVMLTTQKHHQRVKLAAKAELRGLEVQTVFADAKQGREYTNMHTPDDRRSAAFVEYTVSSSGLLTGVEVSHLNMLALGQAFKNQLSLDDTHTILVQADPTSGLGLASWMYLHLIVDQPFLLVSEGRQVNPLLWLHLVAKLDVEVAICTHKALFASVQQFLRCPPQLDKGLSCLSRCIVLCRDRPWSSLISYFETAFKLMKLRRHALCPVLETRPNAFVSMVPPDADRQQAFVDLLKLSRDRIQLLERGSTSEACVWALGEPVPGTKIAVLTPDKNALCGAQQIGEICVSSAHNVKRYTGIAQASVRSVNRRLLGAHLPGRQEAYARTGLYGFLHDGQVFVVGNREDDVTQLGLRHHPVDIEDTIERAFTFIEIGGCAVFGMGDYVIVAVEAEELQQPVLTAAPRIISLCMNKHRVVVNAVMFLQRDSIPMDSGGMKQRQLLKHLITSGQLKPAHAILNHTMA
ncbi:hypothetical protein PTSG_12223 [Salpingoeca rosetta]|uniref:Uncharacterized protein n=1 Tax=Salpingoeca rosetta (strain ATCC 50818 / BSB-021) TaxID=946362 RepID=F2U8X9_SALR5|nr:uncharacterized protein PTSG_12223 [Salpingoeca rosetta]EGD73182.1 hypothetical protein PTSG_12223 [Salpingoeca rosetta]|eukprot:XP_004994213.1 hypothetical protein PTSG_12223 [Salpingoeca rosetta]